METVNRKDNSKYEIEITLNAKETEAYIERTLNQEIKKVKVAGFRPGKMPKKIFLQKYGIESIYPACTDMIINDIYPRIIQEHKIQAVDHPNFDWATLKISKEEGFSIKGEVEVVPEIDLPNIDEIKSKITKKEVKVTKKEIKEAIDNLLAKDAKYETVEDKEAKMGDIVVLDFVGYLDGEAFDGGEAQDYSLTLGSNAFIPGFEDKLVGSKTGEKRDVEVTFPDAYPAEELANKDVVFKCEIKEVKKRTLPKLTAKKIEELEEYDAKDKAELEAQIEERLKVQKEQTLNFEYEKEVLEKLIKAAKLEVPASMIERETEQTLNNLEANFKQQGFGLDMYLQMTGMDIDTLKKQFNIESSLRIAKQIIIDSYLAKNEIKVTEKEVKAEIKKLAEQYNMSEEEIVKRIGEDKEPLKRDLQYQKANDLIFA